MRRAALRVALGSTAVIAGLAGFGCSNDSGVSGTPTPTATTPPPSPTPTPNLVTFALTVATHLGSCQGGAVTEPWIASQIDINLGGGHFDPMWDLTGDTVISSPSGTVTGTAFTASWSWCRFAGGVTRKHEWTWTGSLVSNQDVFFSSAKEILHEATGNVTSNCGVAVTGALGDCTTGGLHWLVSGTRQ